MPQAATQFVPVLGAGAVTAGDQAHGSPRPVPVDPHFEVPGGEGRGAPGPAGRRIKADAEAWAEAGTRRPGEMLVRKEPSRVARKAAALPGPPGVSLEDELDRVGVTHHLDHETLGAA